jgi:Zn-dependent alcohol dehydrogenase
MTAVAMRAAVLRRAGEPLVVETVLIEPPGPGEVRVRVAAAGVCHSDLHLAEGHLGEGRWPTVLGHEGAGVVESVGAGVIHVGIGDPVAFCFVAPCGECRECRAGRGRFCIVTSPDAWRGTLPGGVTRLRDSTGAPLQHFNFVSCFAELAVLPAASVVPVPASLPLWRAALIGCGVVTGFGAVRNVGRVTAGDAVAVIGCGGVGLQVVAAAVLEGAHPVIAVDRDADKLARARARGATHTIDASALPVYDEVTAVCPDGLDTVFEVVGRPDTIRLAWDLLRPGGTAVVVGLAPRGVEVSLPAIDLLSEKALRGTFYGSGDPAVDLATLAGLVEAGRLTVDDVVSAVTDLDGIEAAFERLRRGEGVRTVAVMDPDLAGTDPHH